MYDAGNVLCAILLCQSTIYAHIWFAVVIFHVQFYKEPIKKAIKTYLHEMSMNSRKKNGLNLLFACSYRV